MLFTIHNSHLFFNKKTEEHKNIKFVLLGNGPEKEKLIKLRDELKLTNLRFFDAVPKSEMQRIIMSTNATIIPLKRLDLFKGAIPSKIFENLALKKPIILGVEGEAEELFIKQGKCGVSFIPEDSEDLAKQILKLYNDRNLVVELGENGLKYVSENFNRDKIAEEFYNQISHL